MKTAGAYVPDRGHLVHMNFSPQAGHEQAGRRPAIVLSRIEYNRKTSLMIACPITSQVKGYGFEVPIPPGLSVSGVILADQVKNLDWTQRDLQFVCRVSPSLVNEVLGAFWAIVKP